MITFFCLSVITRTADRSEKKKKKRKKKEKKKFKQLNLTFDQLFERDKPSPNSDSTLQRGPTRNKK